MRLHTLVSYPAVVFSPVYTFNRHNIIVVGFMTSLMCERGEAQSSDATTNSTQITHTADVP